MTAKLFFTRLSFPFSLPFIALKDALYRPNKKYKALKNKHEGKRCFIVCTGPSLTLEDVNKLKNEYTFSMNNIFKCYDKTDWQSIVRQAYRAAQYSAAVRAERR